MDHIVRSPFTMAWRTGVRLPYVSFKELLDKKVVSSWTRRRPQNTGSIIRTDYALADAGIINSVRPRRHITPAVDKASAGAAEHAVSHG
jgi:hypothetical protein